MLCLGGTSVCTAAGASGFSVFINNCNFPMRSIVSGLYADQVSDMKTAHVNFAALEFNNFAPDLISPLPSRMLYITTFRDPLVRIYSQFIHNVMSVKRGKRIEYRGAILKEGCPIYSTNQYNYTFDAFVLEECYEKLHFFHNYYIKMFANESDLNRALVTLQLMSVIIVVDDASILFDK